MRRQGRVVTRTMLLEGRLGLPLRPAHQRHRRPHQPAAPQDRRRGRAAADPHRARLGLQARRQRLTRACSATPPCAWSRRTSCWSRPRPRSCSARSTGASAASSTPSSAPSSRPRSAASPTTTPAAARRRSPPPSTSGSPTRPTATPIYLLADADGRRIAGNLARWPPTVAPGAGWTTLELYRTDRSRPTEISALALAPPARRAAARRPRRRRPRRLRPHPLPRAALGARRDHRALRSPPAGSSRGWSAAASPRSTAPPAASWPARSTAGSRCAAPATSSTGSPAPSTPCSTASRRWCATCAPSPTASPTTCAARSAGWCATSRPPPTSTAPPEARAGPHRAGAARGRGRARHRHRAPRHLAASRPASAPSSSPQVDLGRLAADVAELYEAAAEERGLALACEAAPGLVVQRPRPAPRARALEPRRQRAEARARRLRRSPSPPRRDAGAPALVVADRGPGIPEADRERALGRFVRLDPSRGSPGAGLGLALVAAVARMHGAEIVLADNAPGLRATLRFPG